MLTRLPSPAVAGALLGLACSSPDDSTARGVPQLTDSADVRIARYDDGGAWEPGGGWTVVEALAVGVASGDTPDAFGRIADVAEGPGGSMYVLDQMAQHVVAFDSLGGLLGTLGRPGRGPGELSAFANGVHAQRDGRVLVFDPGQSRLNEYGEDLAFLRSIPLPAPPLGSDWSLDGGRLTYRGITRTRDENGVFGSWDALIRRPVEGGSADTVLVFDYPPTPLGSRENLRVPLIVNAPSWTPLGGGRFAWSSLDQTQVRIHDDTGMLEMLVRHEAWTRAPVTQGVRDALVELLREKLRMLGGDPGGADLPGVEVWDRLPAITHLAAAPGGDLWVQRMGTIDDVDPFAVNDPARTAWLGGPEWDVFAADGTYRGTVLFPPRTRVFDIGKAHALAVVEDEIGVERAVRFSLIR